MQRSYKILILDRIRPSKYSTVGSIAMIPITNRFKRKFRSTPVEHPPAVVSQLPDGCERTLQIHIPNDGVQPEKDATWIRRKKSYNYGIFYTVLDCWYTLFCL